MIGSIVKVVGFSGLFEVEGVVLSEDIDWEVRDLRSGKKMVVSDREVSVVC